MCIVVGYVVVDVVANRSCLDSCCWFCLFHTSLHWRFHSIEFGAPLQVCPNELFAFPIDFERAFKNQVLHLIEKSHQPLAGTLSLFFIVCGHPWLANSATRSLLDAMNRIGTRRMPQCTRFCRLQVDRLAFGRNRKQTGVARLLSPCTTKRNSLEASMGMLYVGNEW